MTTRPLALALALLAASTVARAQNRTYAPEASSSNVHVLSHLPLRWKFTIADIEIEQELSRPYVYVQRDFGPAGFDIISLKDPGHARVIYHWEIEKPELHTGRGGSDGHYLKYQGRYYYVQTFHFGQDGPDPDVGAVIFDVTSLPDTSKIKEVGRIRAPDMLGGYHTLFPYKHSDGRVLVFTTPRGPFSSIYDFGKVLAGDPNQGLIGKVPGMDVSGKPNGYHDYYVAYDAATHQDKFYGAGGTYLTVYDVT